MVLMDSVDHAETAQLDNHVSVEFVCATVDATERNAELTTVEPSVEPVFPVKLATTESVQEPVLLNVPDLMEPSEPVVGIDATVKADVEPAPTVLHATSDAVMVPASAFPTVTTSTAVMMVVVALVEPVLKVESVKPPAILSLDNATSTVTLKSELRSERTRPETWLDQPVQLPSLVPTLSQHPATPTQDLIQDFSLLISPRASTDLTLSPPTVLVTNWTLKATLSMFPDNS